MRTRIYIIWYMERPTAKIAVGLFSVQYILAKSAKFFVIFWLKAGIVVYIITVNKMAG